MQPVVFKVICPGIGTQMLTLEMDAVNKEECCDAEGTILLMTDRASKSTSVTGGQIMLSQRLDICYCTLAIVHLHMYTWLFCPRDMSQ